MLAAAAATAALAAAGCGDSGSDSETVTQPPEPALIPAAVAEKLAKRSDEVAATLDEDLCAAAEKADQLVDDVEKAAAEIPAELRTQLQGAAEQLQNTVNCPPPPEPKKEKKDKEKDKDDEGGYADEEIVGEGDGTSAPGNSGNAPGHNKD